MSYYSGVIDDLHEEVAALKAELATTKAALEAAREAVEDLPEHVHELGCRRGSWERCGCDCDAPRAISAARLALGLEVAK